MNSPEINWAAITAVAAAVAAVRCAWAGGRATGAERAAWVWLAAGAGLRAVAEVLPDPGLRASLHSFAFLPYLAAVSLHPDRERGRAVRAARVIDTLLLGLLLFAVPHHSAISYRRPAGSLWILLVSGVAGAALARQSSRAPEPRWRRIYGLLAGAALAQGAGQALSIWLPDPGGGIDPALAFWSRPAELLELAACGLLAWAARPDTLPGVPHPTPITQHPSPALGWADLLVPAAVFSGLAGIPLGERLFSVAVQSPAQATALVAAWHLYVLLILGRQLVVQMESQALSRDLHRESVRLRLLVDNIHDAVITEDLNQRIIFANDRFFELFETPSAGVLGRKLEEFIHSEDRALGRDRPEHRMNGSLVPLRTEFRGQRRGGNPLFLESSLTPVRVGGLLLGYQSVIRDITERRRAEERRRELVQRLEFFLNNMPLGCIVFDLEYRIVEWNQAATRIFGWTGEEAFGRHGMELLVAPELWPSLLSSADELQRTKTTNQASNQNLTKDRGVIDCEWFNTSLIDHDGRVVAIASMVLDITERKSLEAQLRQSQKMEAVGVLAGGVAHDFNNLLTIILGNISMAQLRLGPGHAAERGLGDAERAADRAAELVRQLLGFSRKSRSEPRPTSLNTCVEETLVLLRSMLDPRITVEVSTEPELWLVEADPGQIHQVVVNLCMNARDAMPYGGALTIRTSPGVIEERYCRAHPDARPGEFVELSVADTGHGMDAATAARIFEPFFTTKKLGKGTGLGLAMVYGIVRQHGGWVVVESEPGQGSTFRILLPRTQTTLVTAEEPGAGAATGGGPETILLVDDEEMIVRLGRAILEANGHRVLEARDGEEALEVFHRHRSEIRLVLLDERMPRKGGSDTLRELQRLAPEVPVVLASGYAAVGSDELLALGAKAYLQKPYRPTELARTIRQVLDAMADG